MKYITEVPYKLKNESQISFLLFKYGDEIKMLVLLVLIVLSGLGN